jgi:hypothetical protein
MSIRGFCGRRAQTSSLARVGAVGIVLALISLGLLGSRGAARQAELGFSPASGHAQVIAQGVVSLPEGESVWRTVRTRASLPAEAPFEERPLGFVFASTGPILLVDQATGEQTHLGTGEAALVRTGSIQQRSSLGEQPVSYLSIELVPSNSAPPADGAIVLQPGQPFPTPPGLHDLDLLSATLVANETFTIPDSGAKNVVLVTEGAANVGRPGAEAVVLLAGEAASFSGELQMAAAPGSESVSFLVAIIGPEIPPVAVPTAATSQEPTAAAQTPVAQTGLGSIAVQVFTCPPGMDAQTLAAAACAPASGDFDITISGSQLAAPLTLSDATVDGDSLLWDALAFGDYSIAEAVLPAGATTYVLALPGAVGGPDTGYEVTLDANQSHLTLRFYNFIPE